MAIGDGRDGSSPPEDATLVALALPLFVSAGAVHGTALALARSGDELFYLVDNAAIDGPPLWVHEREIERCALAPLLTHPE
jgi:hypothetical protein